MQKLMKLSRGFTLIELIVVIAVLLVVVGTAVGVFISIVQHQRIILDEQELLNQVSYALEHMSKALRMAGKESSPATCLEDGFGTYPGYNYLLTRPIAGVYTGIKFINQSDSNACQEFYLDADNSDPDHPIAVLKEIKNNGPRVAITSDKFMINFIRFGVNGGDGCYGVGCVNGASENDGIQPRVTIYLDIQTKGDNQSTKKFQTTISQRNLNVQ